MITYSEQGRPMSQVRVNPVTWCAKSCGEGCEWGGEGGGVFIQPVRAQADT